MAKQSTPSPNEEKRLIERLRQRPDLFERINAIMALAESPEGDRRTADEIEALLVEEVRRLGKTTMESWASSAEEQASQEFKRENPDSRYGKKNS